MDGFVVSTTTMSLLALTSFCFLSQSAVTLASINTTQKRSCFHWSTSQDGHLSNCLRQGETDYPHPMTKTKGLYSD